MEFWNQHVKLSNVVAICILCYCGGLIVGILLPR